jgi:RsiW-degrading membrane proteinase PrsW (M82 family)
LLLTGIPLVLISGLVQEGAKLFPTVIYWQYHGRKIDPKLGLTLGAMAGAGFGIIEAQWIHNMIFAAGWTPEIASTLGITAYAGFWERFFTVCFHISVSALAGWGLARGWGWQFYLIASFAHGFVNYSAILTQTGVFNTLMAEIFIALCAVIVFMIVIQLRWRKSDSGY